MSEQEKPKSLRQLKNEDALDGCEADFTEQVTTDDELEDLIEKEE